MGALKRNVHDVLCTCSFKSAGWLGRCASHCGAGHESRINPNNLSQVRGSTFTQLFLVWFAGDMKSERSSKDGEQHCRCVVWEEKTVLQSLDVASPHQIGKDLSFASFIAAKADVDWLCFKEIRAVAEPESERFSPWQGEHYHL